MKNKPRSLFIVVSILSALFFFPFAGKAADNKDTIGEVKCHLDFTLSSWSAFYKSGKGQGTITCDNGQKSAVKIRAKGGGITFGKSKVLDGYGQFSKVRTLQNLYGSYAESEAHAGASGSSSAHAMWNGDISLVISGTGKGWDLGVNFGSFKITPR